MSGPFLSKNGRMDFPGIPIENDLVACQTFFCLGPIKDLRGTFLRPPQALGVVVAKLAQVAVETMESCMKRGERSCDFHLFPHSVRITFFLLHFWWLSRAGDHGDEDGMHLRFL